MYSAGFGLASHLGVLADLPTIGVGKNVGCVLLVATHKYSFRRIQLVSVSLLSEETNANVSIT